ncbi:DUF6705 family protein [Haloflavibacter putidus]|uniref:DUF6705 domain-containing protein n=1 Tax=Haloflavibacter putidus TaxID=2576776 RepID=A0A507ZWM1_9FLAO|nr:DUF6705 family protein [Haloflavibacter putidus]TQD40664.1 hypothetical protein FKR84_01400 [Haloflavibacter putidus]
MKNIITLVFLLTLIAFNCKAQTISLSNVNRLNIPDGAYVKDTDGKLNAFVGTWQWTNGSDEFTVVFVKKLMDNGNGASSYYEDFILGGYRYIENGIEVANNLNFTTSFDVNDISTFANYAKIITSPYNNFKTLRMQVGDVVKHKSLGGSFELINPLTLPNGNFTATEAHWKLREKEFISVNGKPALPEEGIGLPNDIILTKQ